MPLLFASDDIRVVPLGAGQDVGRSCVLVTMGGRTIMFDCGMHMGYNDARRFPDFTQVAQGPLTDHIDLAIITHFHLDHCGALPYFTEQVGYDGPLYMTMPTRAIAQVLLEDYRKIAVSRQGEKNFFTRDDIKTCLNKATTIDLHQTVVIDQDFEIKAYYAGHVLGAAMFYVRVGNQSVVYTGDYNMSPDRHLGAAWIDRCEPDVIISESTYATTIRDSRRAREHDLLTKITQCVQRGGKVLLPVFALGRAQELCILLETHWQRTGMRVPIYFSTGLTARANEYYKLFITWTNQKLKETFVERNLFDFQHVQPFDRSYLEHAGPQVLFATPGMLHAGTSLLAFTHWCEDPRNMVILPGYCTAGTVGAKIIAGIRELDIEGRHYTVRMDVEYLSFSAHADAKGIMQLVSQSGAKQVVLVHGEQQKMAFLAGRIQQELGLPCHFPPNGHCLTLSTNNPVPILVSDAFLPVAKDEVAKAEPSFSPAPGPKAELLAEDVETKPNPSHLLATPSKPPMALDGHLGLGAAPVPIEGVLVRQSNGKLRLVTFSEAQRDHNLQPHEIKTVCVIALPSGASTSLVHRHILQRSQAAGLAVLDSGPTTLKVGLVDVSIEPNEVRLAYKSGSGVRDAARLQDIVGSLPDMAEASRDSLSKPRQTPLAAAEASTAESRPPMDTEDDDEDDVNDDDDEEEEEDSDDGSGDDTEEEEADDHDQSDNDDDDDDDDSSDRLSSSQDE
ncbi:uncharacterized protein MONBRDRAFT_37658 [Monosiga brevicollis MX1]|uniref:Integrator complex subunit 11 n=1 Tax=Monosiga brevicollis TaxID=81824 RepID=A9V338_MONBE|nr:uncharacterized protein MONBRDRAFT_37658 [Monosiga brevicollis MX1]EDQ87993.1 predicted protein [Monosiga brevicollis MX1]|eukprot:XP_001747069.1 hypothetical protein [Monosiga brevicollis MX1]